MPVNQIPSGDNQSWVLWTRIFISKSEKNLNEKSKITFELLIEDLLKNETYTKFLPENGYAKDT
ncbi:MAG: hypothetical protein DRH24_10395 [Deltaproteobacteria bacterium]|nr:MAG: hypothetical protein DRH24_10395 [Deltaproteobacteria bacterium]